MQMYERVARAIAATEASYSAAPAEVQEIAREFFQMMSHGLFLPNSPTLMNASLPNGLLSACFVLGIPDSVEGIFEAVKRTAMVQKAGGGTGFAFDALRPTGDLVASSGGATSGPLSFLRVFSEASNAIQQGARRRGANMAMMSVEHPDILSFICAKRNPGELANFNISVKIPNTFMEALRSSPGSPHVVTNFRTGMKYQLPRSLAIGRYGLQDLLPASRGGQGCYTVWDVWNMIVANAHATGEPGACYIDQVNRYNPTPALGRIESTNPCGEQMLLPEEACVLGSINVSKFVISGTSEMNWPALGRTVRPAVRFLDDVVDANFYPIPQIREMTLGNRKIGLGHMGFADALILLGLRYDSDEAIAFARKLGSFIQQTSHQASEEPRNTTRRLPQLGREHLGHRAPRQDAQRCLHDHSTHRQHQYPGRVQSGHEPVYSLAYRRRVLDGREFIQIHPLLERIGRREGWLTDAVRQALLEGTPAGQIKGIPRRVRKTLVTAHEIAPEWHVRMQAAFQEHVDNAVSKTVNLPADASVADVDKVFRMAFELGCKGITVYRDRSREGQTLTTTRGQEKPGVALVATPRPRERVTVGKTFKYRMGCGTLFVTVNRDDNGLCEVFANLGKAGGCPSQSEATCRVTSVALRSRVDPKELVEQLRGIRCLSTATARKDRQDVDVLSCPDAIARAIEEAMGNSSESLLGASGNLCPDCGLRLKKEEGCLVCACGFSRCT